MARQRISTVQGAWFVWHVAIATLENDEAHFVIKSVSWVTWTDTDGTRSDPKSRGYVGGGWGPIPQCTADKEDPVLSARRGVRGPWPSRWVSRPWGPEETSRLGAKVLEAVTIRAFREHGERRPSLRTGELAAFHWVGIKPEGRSRDPGRVSTAPDGSAWGWRAPGGFPRPCAGGEDAAETQTRDLTAGRRAAKAHDR